MIALRPACDEDVPLLARLASASKKELGFILYPQYFEAIKHESLITAWEEEKLVGFVLFHHRRDEQTTLSYLCVDQNTRRKGIGNMLVARTVLAAHQAGKHCVSLKAIETIDANKFYRAQGFVLSATVQGKKSRMNVWKLRWED